jgi:hypothetical protein
MEAFQVACGECFKPSGRTGLSISESCSGSLRNHLDVGPDKVRYGFTHYLRWSLSSKRVDLAIALVVAGIIVATLSGLLLP